MSYILFLPGSGPLKSQLVLRGGVGFLDLPDPLTARELTWLNSKNLHPSSALGHKFFGDWATEQGTGSQLIAKQVIAYWYVANTLSPSWVEEIVVFIITCPFGFLFIDVSFLDKFLPLFDGYVAGTSLLQPADNSSSCVEVSYFK